MGGSPNLFVQNTCFSGCEAAPTTTPPPTTTTEEPLPWQRLLDRLRNRFGEEESVAEQEQFSSPSSWLNYKFMFGAGLCATFFMGMGAHHFLSKRGDNVYLKLIEKEDEF